MSATDPRGHILVVEDDPDIRESVVEVLEDEGYRVSTAADGRQALGLLATATPDLIFLDLMMPVMNGFQFREEQLKDQRLSAIPILVVTADANAKAKAEALKAAGFVQKPLKIQPLLDLIAQLLARL